MINSTHDGSFRFSLRFYFRTMSAASKMLFSIGLLHFYAALNIPDTEKLEVSVKSVSTRYAALAAFPFFNAR